MTNNLKIEKIITENAHLIEGAEMPQLFRNVLAHVAGYKALIKTWETHPLSDTPEAISFDDAVRENTPMLPYPRDFSPHVQQIFDTLKQRQQHLIGLIETRSLRA